MPMKMERSIASSRLKNQAYAVPMNYPLPIGKRFVAYYLRKRKDCQNGNQLLKVLREPEEKLFRKEEELDLADCISCPSEFVLQSIPKNIRSEKNCIVAPFGSPPCLANKRLRKDHESKTLKLLFVGSMSQRKGLADLFKAMEMLRNEPVSLTVLGQPSMPMEFYRKNFTQF
jgi:glycosyltransferase involved in cell wall biosynthesis